MTFQTIVVRVSFNFL